MDEKERRRERRRWRRWKLFNWLSYLFGFGLLRGLLFGLRPSRSHDGEPPLLELDRIAREGSVEAKSVRTSDTAQVEGMLALLKTVAHTGGETSHPSSDFAREFIRLHIPVQDQRAGALERLMDYYERCDPAETNLKNICYLLRKNLNRNLKLQFIETLYRLSYRVGLTPTERMEIDFIGEDVGLSSSEIRQALFAGKKG